VLARQGAVKKNTIKNTREFKGTVEWGERPPQCMVDRFSRLEKNTKIDGKKGRGNNQGVGKSGEITEEDPGVPRDLPLITLGFEKKLVWGERT